MKYLAFGLMALTFSVFAQKVDDSVTVINSDEQVDGIENLSTDNDSEPDRKSNGAMMVFEDAKSQSRTPAEIIKGARKHYVDHVNALNLFNPPNKLKSITVPISIEPGQDAYPIDVAVNYGVTLHFKNTAGETLFIHRYKEGVEKILDVDDGGKEGDETVTSYLTLTNMLTVGSTNLHVWLMNKNHSLSFHTKIIESPEEYVDRITFVVIDPSEAASGQTLSIDAYDALTMALNNRKPDPKATKIRFSDPSVIAWKLGDMMWLRTAKRLVFPTYSPKMALSSDKADGINVYYVASHPIIHLVDKVGRFEKITIMPENGGAL